MWVAYKCAKMKKNLTSRFREFGVKVHKFENSRGKNSPKNGDGGQGPRFRDLSRPLGPLSPGVKIDSQNPLGEEILGVKF